MRAMACTTHWGAVSGRCPGNHRLTNTRPAGANHIMRDVYCGSPRYLESTFRLDAMEQLAGDLKDVVSFRRLRVKNREADLARFSDKFRTFLRADGRHY